jgi:hypothetical protein
MLSLRYKALVVMTTFLAVAADGLPIFDMASQTLVNAVIVAGKGTDLNHHPCQRPLHVTRDATQTDIPQPQLWVKPMHYAPVYI